MPRNYTKYNVDGLGEGLNKRQLVFTIVKNWIERNSPSFEELVRNFPNDIQGSLGVLQPEAEISDHKRFDIKRPLKVKNGKHIVVCNQWGIENIIGFIQQAEKLGYKIQEQTSEKHIAPPSVESLNQFVEDNFWEIGLALLDSWDPAWGRFLCLNIHSIETTLNMWFYIYDEERNKGVAIAPNNLPEDKSETWFGEPEWAIELPETYLEDYNGPLTVVIYKNVPSSFFEHGQLKWDSDDENFVYMINEERGEEEGELPEGLTKSIIRDAIPGHVVSLLYHTIRELGVSS